MAEGGRVTRMPRSGSEELLEMIREEFPSYHPVLSMVRMAHEEGLEDNLRLQAHKEVANYVLPKLRQVDVRVEQEEDMQLHVVLEGQAEQLDAPPPLTEGELEAVETRGELPLLSQDGDAEVVMFEEVTPCNRKHEAALNGTYK